MNFYYLHVKQKNHLNMYFTHLTHTNKLHLGTKFNNFYMHKKRSHYVCLNLNSFWHFIFTDSCRALAHTSWIFVTNSKPNYLHCLTFKPECKKGILYFKYGTRTHLPRVSLHLLWKRVNTKPTFIHLWTTQKNHSSFAIQGFTPKKTIVNI